MRSRIDCFTCWANKDVCMLVFSGSGSSVCKIYQLKVKGVYSSSFETHLRATERYSWARVCHMGSHIVTCHPTQMNAPRLTPARQAGTRFTYSGGMEGWVDLGGSVKYQIPLYADLPETSPWRVTGKFRGFKPSQHVEMVWKNLMASRRQARLRRSNGIWKRVRHDMTNGLSHVAARQATNHALARYDVIIYVFRLRSLL